MFKTCLLRLVLEENGAEMIEWALLGVIFALSGAVFWGDLVIGMDGALGRLGRVFAEGASCGTPPCGLGPDGSGPPGYGNGVASLPSP